MQALLEERLGCFCIFAARGWCCGNLLWATFLSEHEENSCLPIGGTKKVPGSGTAQPRGTLGSSHDIRVGLEVAHKCNFCSAHDHQRRNCTNADILARRSSSVVEMNTRSICVRSTYRERCMLRSHPCMYILLLFTCLLYTSDAADD